jgi:hypothetical protein
LKKKLLSLLLTLALTAAFVGCGAKNEAPVAEEPAVTEEAVAEEAPVKEETPAVEETETTEAAALPVPDGEYTVRFTTDSGMFHINETLDNKATLTVKDGKGTVHITLAGTGILNLYLGLAADAEANEANWLQPTEDEVTYDDGTTETVYGFDVPVPVVDEEFDLALVGSKGTWYDHKVKVEMPQ